MCQTCNHNYCECITVEGNAYAVQCIKNVLYVCKCSASLLDIFMLYIQHFPSEESCSLVTTAAGTMTNNTQPQLTPPHSTLQSGRMGSCVVRMVASSLPAPPSCSL